MFKTLANNRRARHEYSILKAMEAGIELRGTEVKSIREGMINLSESYCVIDEKMQAFLLNAHIAHYNLETATIMIPCAKGDCCFIDMKSEDFTDKSSSKG